MAEISIALDKRSSKKDGSFPVKLIVYHNRENKRYGLAKKISLTEQQWEKINSKNLKNEELLIKKKYLESEKGRALKIVERLGNEFTYELFEAFFLGNKVPKQADQNVLYSLFEDYITELGKDERLGTAESYESALKSIRSYAPNLPLKELTPKFLERYEKWMLDNDYSITTVGIYLRSFRTIVNIAKDKKLITEELYPFGKKSKKKYEIPTGKNVKKALEIENIKKIKDAKCNSSEQEFARDIWLFSLYCSGMNMVDIFSLKYKNIRDSFFYFNRSKTIRTRKTQEPVEIYLSEPVKDIIDKWGNKNRNGENYIFDIFTPSMTVEERHHKRLLTIRSINGYMKRLGKSLGVDTKITTYVARHSWATLLKNMGVSIEEISENLGHTDISTTKDYLDSFPKEHKKETSNKLTSLL